MDDTTYTNGGLAILIFLALVFLGLRFLQNQPVPVAAWIGLAILGALLMVLPALVFWLLIPIALVVGLKYGNNLQGMIDQVLNLKVGGR